MLEMRRAKFMSGFHWSIFAVVAYFITATLLIQPARAQSALGPTIVDHYMMAMKGQPMPSSCAVSTVRVVESRDYLENNVFMNRRLCISTSQHYRVGRQSIYNMAIYISFGNDTLFYRIDTLTPEGPWMLQYHGVDDRVGLSVAGDGVLSSIASVYESLIDVIEPNQHTGAPYVLSPDKMNAKHIARADKGAQYGWTLSNNSQYLAYISVHDIMALELDFSVRLVNIASGTTRTVGRFMMSADEYIQGGVLLSVSDDGHRVVAVDSQKMRIYDVTDECGVSDSSADQCYVSEHTLQLDIDMTGFHLYEQQPNHDLSEIVYTLFRGSYRSQVLVSLTGDSSIPKLTYLALGDSYSSGEGDVADGGAYYLPGTKLPGQCHLSSRSYPFVLRDWWRAERSTMASVACSGAQILRDYVAQPTSYKGQGNRLEGLLPSQAHMEREVAINLKKPGIVEQIEFVKKYTPQIVTLTGGGNDVGFAEVLTYCASGASIVQVPDTCTYAKEGSLPQRMIEQSIDNQYRAMSQLIGEISAASPTTKIYVVGYPQFVGANLFCSLNVALLDQRERQMVRDMTSRLNDVLSRAAADSSAAFADIEDALEGGQLCQGSEYVSGLHDIITKEDRNEMFHPNAAGHSKMAHVIFGQVPSLAAHVETSTRPGAKSSEEYLSTSISKQVTVMKSTIDPKTFQAIHAPEATFQPNSSVRITIFSEPMQLGSFVAGDDGGLEANVALPDTIIPGHHTLVLEGVTYSGEPITLYQFVTVTSGIPGDTDGDGIPDEQDRCNFITEWIDEKTGVDVCIHTGLQYDDDVAEEVGGSTGVRTRMLPQDGDTVLQGWHTRPAFFSTPYASLGFETSPIGPLSTERLVKPDTKSETSSKIVWIVSVVAVLIIAIMIGAGRRYGHKTKETQR